MFGVKHNECIGFESRWKVTKVICEAVVQTTEFSNTDAGTVTVQTTDSEVQCETPKQEPPNVDMDKLAGWLNDLYPKVKTELDDSTYSRVFQGYRLVGDSIDVSCKVVQSIDVAAETEEKNQALRISSISWNFSGKLLAVAGNYDHGCEWCLHSGYIRIYRLNRDGSLDEKAYKTFDVESCVTELRFHLKQESLLAVGTYSGTIAILNTSHDEGDHLVGEIEAHDDTVTQLSWVADENSPMAYNLASCSMDATLSMWNMNQSGPVLNILHKYKMKTPIFTSGRQEASNLIDKVIRGVICFDFSKHIPDMFIAGLEGGLVAQCSMSGASKLKGSTKEVQIYDPIYMYHEPHGGELNTIKFSPNRKEMFMTCASDKEIRIYLIGQEEPARIVFLKEVPMSATWIPYEDKLMACCGHSGMVDIFDIIAGEQIENVVREKQSDQVLAQLTINPTSSSKVAVGNLKGVVQLWHVPWNGITSSIMK